MKLTTSFALVSVLVVACATSACDRNAAGGSEPINPGATAAVPKPKAPEPTAARVALRSQERWNKAMKPDWIAVYDFLVPEGKRELPIARFLGGMDNHKYENMKVIEVLAVKDDKAYVRSGGLWTPQAPELAHVHREPGQTFTQEIQMIETWRWVDGDWSFVRPQRDTDFFAEHPELLKKAPADKPQDAVPAK